MNIAETLRLALNSIMTNRTRAALTMLGIIIGIGSVIGLISLGQGVEAYVRDEFAGLGANLLIVYSSEPEADTRDRIEPITMEDYETIGAANFDPSVGRVGATFSVVGYVAANGESIGAGITGVTPNVGEIRDWYAEKGTYITQQHVDNKDRVVVLGRDIVEELWDDPDLDVTGETVRINEVAFTVVGVMEDRSSAFTNDNTAVIVPISTAQTRLGNARASGGYQVSQLYVQARTSERVEDAEFVIDQYFYDKHDINFDGEQDYTIVNQEDLMDILGAVTGLLTSFLGVIAGISLLVGGIGIMNIMLVTVTERTREIGLRKAVGAQGRDILMQFLMESLVLSLLGGIVGILVGWSITVIGTIAVPNLPLSVTPGAVALATGVSSFVGIFFGIFPASRAARMRPIDALRYE